MDELVVLEGPDAGRRFALLPGTRVIGRGVESHVALRDPFVSRRHVALRSGGGELWLQDLGARNPPRVNGVRVREARLRSGDRLRIGETELLVLTSGGRAGPPADPNASTLGLESAFPCSQDPFARLVGQSPALRSAVEELRAAARLESTLLLLGETGTGKELAAQAVHEASSRSQKPFIQVNAGGIPEGLAEAELFGHERGAFTGADRRRPGRLELARGGTLFLDEVGELPLGLQAALLRALETRSFRRLGGSAAVHADFRLLAATNRELDREVAAGRFRRDLYYRLHVLVVRMPPLRARPGDIPLLARRFAKAAARECARPAPRVQKRTAAWLTGRPWPGNVRELKHAVLRAVLRAEGGELAPADFREAGAAGPLPETPAGGLPPRSLQEVERAEIERVLAFTGGNKTRAAQILGIGRNTLYQKLRAHGLQQ